MLSLGAINKSTNSYVSARNAVKSEKYKCPDCEKDVVCCQGSVIAPYFRHYSDGIKPCHYYDKPSESQIHKDAKIIMKTMLESNIPIQFARKCRFCKNVEEFEIPQISDTSVIQLEHRFQYNGDLKIADVAYLDEGEITCLFEICYKHKTNGWCRPEPWFEIDAESLIHTSNSFVSDKIISISCIRNEICEECNLFEISRKKKKDDALEILYTWFCSGSQILPFVCDYADYAEVVKNTTCEYINEIFDLILRVDKTEKFDQYCIRLCYYDGKSDFRVSDAKRITYCNIGVYWLDIEWVLSQYEIPTRIQYLACIDKYNSNSYSNDVACPSCGNEGEVWIKRVSTKAEHKTMYIGTTGCSNDCAARETEYLPCARCKTTTPLCVIETNVIRHNIMCKSCDIELYNNGNVYLSVPFQAKDKIKSFGGLWDIKYKTWYVRKDNTNIDKILRFWKRIWY